jgi:hypothetical protein
MLGLYLPLLDWRFVEIPVDTPREVLVVLVLPAERRRMSLRFVPVCPLYIDPVPVFPDLAAP